MHIQIIVFYEHKYQTPMSPGFIDVGDGWPGMGQNSVTNLTFCHVRSLDISVRHQYLKYDTRILLLSPASEKCHQFLVAKIMLAPTSYKPYYLFSTLAI